jgi:hypothetical protein
MAADGRRFLNQVDLETRLSQVEGGLYTADPSTHDHDIAEIVFFGTVVQLSFIRFFFHRLSSHQIFCARIVRDGRVSRRHSL